MPADHSRGEFRISTDSARVDVDAVQAFLARSHWAQDIPREIVARAVSGSIPFSLFHRDRQIGFARVVTDKATFAYLADVYVLEQYRGQGLARWLIGIVMEHPDLQGLRRFSLATRDAHALYAHFGFKSVAAPERLMEIVRPGIYVKSNGREED